MTEGEVREYEISAKENGNARRFCPKILQSGNYDSHACEAEKEQRDVLR